jgi:hypothetical protein
MRFESRDYEDYCIPVYDAVLPSRSLPTFWRNMLSLHFHGTSTLKVEARVSFRNVRDDPRDYTSSHPQDINPHLILPGACDGQGM